MTVINFSSSALNVSLYLATWYSECHASHSNLVHTVWDAGILSVIDGPQKDFLSRLSVLPILHAEHAAPVAVLGV